MKDNLTTPPIDSASLGKRVLLGAGIALVLISVFLFGVKNPKPEWGGLWMLKPLVIVPIAGAMGGVFYYVINHFRYVSGWKKIAAFVVGLLGYVVALWLGTVLGLNGTLWN